MSRSVYRTIVQYNRKDFRVFNASTRPIRTQCIQYTCMYFLKEKNKHTNIYPPPPSGLLTCAYFVTLVFYKL